MSGSMIPIIAVMAIAAEEAVKKRKEEEDMTGYNKGDLDGWEFKIVRSNTGRFKKYDNIKKVCDEEALAGWDMVEKFDNNRIRFKRRTDKRGGDQYLETDPYRTNVSSVSRQTIGVIVGLLILAAGLALFFGLNVSSDGGSSAQIPLIIGLIVVVIGGLLAIKAGRKK